MHVFGNFSSLLSNGGTIRHSYMPADRLTTVPVLLPLRPCSAKAVLSIEPHTVQLRLSKLAISPTTASCTFHHTSGGVWTISHKYYRLLSDLIDNILSKTSLQISRMILELEEKS